jgi:hypothetical protein
LSTVVKSRKQPRFILISGGVPLVALRGVVPAPFGPEREKSVIINGNDTALQTPGTSATKVVSEPVKVVVVVLVLVDDNPTQEVRSPTASAVVRAIAAIRLSIRSRLSPSLVLAAT